MVEPAMLEHGTYSPVETPELKWKRECKLALELLTQRWTEAEERADKADVKLADVTAQLAELRTSVAKLELQLAQERRGTLAQSSRDILER